VVSQNLDDVFCLYLWRSLDAPGTLYLARDMHSAREVSAELIAAGYTVRVVQMVTNVEHELRDGDLVPCGLDESPHGHRTRPVHEPQPSA
jgi:hypothetical protein